MRRGCTLKLECPHPHGFDLCVDSQNYSTIKSLAVLKVLVEGNIEASGVVFLIVGAVGGGQSHPYQYKC